MGMFEYRKLVVQTAWGRFKQRIFAGAQRMIGFILQTAILFAILYFQPWLGNVGDESRLAAAGVAAVLGSALINFIWDLIRAPEVLWKGLSTRIDELERILRPKFSVLVSNNGKPRRYNYGNVLRSRYTGSTQAVGLSSFDVLALDVTNITAGVLENCEAYLARLEQVGGEPTAFNSLRLEWVPVGDETAVTSIPSLGQRTLVVFQVVGNRAAFSHDNMPLQAAVMLRDDGLYDGTISLSAKGTATALVDFQLECTKDEPPRFTLIRRRIGEVDVIDVHAPETHIGF